MSEETGARVPTPRTPLRLTGSADQGKLKVIPDVVTVRALRNFDLEAPTGCHISRYSIGSHGYAQVGWQLPRDEQGRKKIDCTTAHRAAWTAVYGQIPEGMTIDHMCKNRRCVNVQHLRILTNFQNARRTSGRDWPVGTCIRGHSDSRLRKAGGKWVCGPCDAAAQREYRRRRKMRLEAATQAGDS